MIGKSATEAAAWLRKGEVVGLPTETVYGLAGNIFDAGAIRKIYEVKGRPLGHPLIVHCKDVEAVKALCVRTFPPMAQRLAAAFWPGPLTMILPKKESIPLSVTGGRDYVGIRVPSHPLFSAVLEEVGFPVAAPSANPYGYISPTSAAHVAAQLGDRVPYILDGGICDVGVESTIVEGLDRSVPVVLRLGGIPLERLEGVVGKVSLLKSAEKKVTVAVPGNLPWHYAPHTPLVVGEVQTLLQKLKGKKVGLLLFQKAVEGVPLANQVVLSERGSLEEAAQGLFKGLHHLDSLGCDWLLAPRFPDVGLGRTINERLSKADGRRFTGTT